MLSKALHRVDERCAWVLPSPGPSRFQTTHSVCKVAVSRRPRLLPARSRRCSVRTSPSLALVPVSGTVTIVALLVSCGAVAQQLAARSRIARALSAPVCTMLLAAILANAGVLPPPPIPVVSQLQSVATRVATPLLLLGADLRVVFRETKELAMAFLLCSLGTALGSAIAFLLLRPSFAGAVPLCAAIAAKNVGGGINFLAVLDTYGFNHLISLGLNADNIVGLVYFPVNSWLSDRFVGGREKPENPLSNATNAETGAPTMQSITTALALALAIAALAKRILPTAHMPLSAAITVTAATLCPSWLRHLVPTGNCVGTVLLYILFACAGAAGGPLAQAFGGGGSAAAGLAMVGYCAILYTVHIGVCLSAIVVLRRTHGSERRSRAQDILLGSNAAIGGPSTAAALAETKQWPSKVVPASIVGNFGNAIGSFVGLGMGYLLMRIFP